MFAAARRLNYADMVKAVANAGLLCSRSVSSQFDKGLHRSNFSYPHCSDGGRMMFPWRVAISAIERRGEYLQLVSFRQPCSCWK